MVFIVVTCSGISNTGKLTAQTGARLLHSSCGAVESCIEATRPTASLEEVVRHADRILVLDGCSDCYGKKKVRADRGRTAPPPGCHRLRHREERDGRAVLRGDRTPRRRRAEGDPPVTCDLCVSRVVRAAMYNTMMIMVRILLLSYQLLSQMRPRTMCVPQKREYMVGSCLGAPENGPGETPGSLPG